MKSEQMRITIGLPVFNGEIVLAEAIESVLQQSYKNFVLIISDNASTDATGEICENFAARDRRIKYFRQAQNLGPVENFNFVKRSCETEFFVWLASDDRWHPNFLEEMLAIMDKSQDCSLAFCNFSVRNLETGSSENVQINSAEKNLVGQRILTRIRDMKPSLVYGLQRQSLMQDLELGLFDFSDVFFSIQAAKRGRIKIAETRLYTAGTKGKRKAYSLTGKKICRSTFFIHATRMFFTTQSIPTAVTLSMVLSYMLTRHFFVFSLQSLLGSVKSNEGNEQC
jgi:glycosyltransferase involved in cell wall biosynthesis